MTLAQLQAFSELAARGSFTLAAAQLGMTQSGVSHAIRSLEREWGVVLFTRSSGRIELTDIGLRLLPRAQSMLGMAEAMRQEASSARGLKSGTLRIGSFGPTSSIHLLPPILNDYRSRYPGISVYVDEGPDREVLQWLLDRRSDIGFVVLPDNRFDTFPLFEDHMVAILPNAHPLAERQNLSLADLCEFPFILTEAGSAKIVTNLFITAGLRPNIQYRTAQLLTTIDLVARGSGVSIVAQGALPKENPRYVVKALNPPVVRTVGLAVNNENDISSATKAFLDLAIRRWCPRPKFL